MTPPLDDLPKVTAWFDEPDEQSVPLLIAIGRLVWLGAGLEKVLQMAIAQISIEQAGKLPPEDRLARWDRMTGGQLLGELRKLDVPEALADRIKDVVDGRNEIIHRMYENADIVRAVANGSGVDTAVEHVGQIARECGRIAVELAAVVVPRFEAMLGATAPELAAFLRSLDPAAVDDESSRKQLEAVQIVLDAGIELTMPWQAAADDREHPG